jgi:DNA polymerase III subunit gamma/tau
MGVCEPGQGGNAAAINNTFMCLGEPPRLSRTPAWNSCLGSITSSPNRGMTERANVAVRRESKKRSSPSKAEAPEPTAVQSAPDPAPEPEPAQAPHEVSPPQQVKETERPARRSPAPTYTVVARRYRPQRFDDVVGQDHVVQSLKNAIRLNRIAQAYLFCGTRGVGKTSMARIFAKCLNCGTRGPTDNPCQTCDICQAITVGQDIDVIEIDGASNNGVEQVRELRQHASLRPSRARYKIYYIDEVHMLSTGAFNALLKTLEEPPPHVKFLFATTEANKIPITVLSRCQRYDFAGIIPEAIARSLGEICTREGVEFESDALQVVARRAGGSLRDAQSLLDRLLASGSPKLTVEIVHSLLGTATDERLLRMFEALTGHDSALALSILEQSAGEGVQPAELLGGLIDLIRDGMILAVGAAESLLLAISPRDRAQLKTIVERSTIDSIMASLQILQECRARMRGSIHGRLLLEIALVRVARLEELESLSTLVERLRALESGAPPRRLETRSARLEPSTTASQTAAGPPPAQAEVAPSPPVARATHAQPEAKPGPAMIAPLPARAEVVPDTAAVPDASSPDRSPAAVPEQPLPAPVQSSSLQAPQAGNAPTSRGAAVLETPPPAPAAIAPDAPAPAPPRPDASHPLDLDAIKKVWPDLVKKVGTGLGWKLAQVEPLELEGPDVLVIAARPGYNSTFDECGTPEAQAKIGQALQRLIHRQVTIKYIRRAAGREGQTDSRPNEAERANSLSRDPMVQRVLELFEARPVQMDYGELDPSQED